MKITPIKKAPSVGPLPGWALECEHGHQAKDSTPGGGLVRLATVVQWLQQSQRLPRINAVDALCSKLDERALGALYRIKSGAFAVRVPNDSRFGFKASKPVQTSAQRPKPSFVNPGYLSTYPVRHKVSSTSAAAPVHPTVEPGLPALIARLRNDWNANQTRKQGECDPLDDRRTLSAFLALPIGLAYELWGWGVIANDSGEVAQQVDATRVPDCVSNFEDLLQVLKAAPGSKWKPDMLRALLTEEESRKKRPGSKGVRVALARELGSVSVQRVGQLIKAAKALPPEAPSLRPGASVFNLG